MLGFSTAQPSLAARSQQLQQLLGRFVKHSTMVKLKL